MLTPFRFGTLLLALGASLSNAAPKTPYKRCGSEPPEELKAVAADMARTASSNGFAIAAAHAPIVVNTYFHVVTSTAKQGLYTQTQLNNQLSYMNNAYGSHGITYKLISSDFTTNNNWATGNYDR